MRTQRTQVLRFYIASQDGREEHGAIEYDTEAEAEEARMKLPEVARKSLYVACYWRTVHE